MYGDILKLSIRKKFLNTDQNRIIEEITDLHIVSKEIYEQVIQENKEKYDESEK
jgi:hypothetical protein